jgi:hypothetical protein
MKCESNNSDDEAVYQNAAQVCTAVAFYLLYCSRFYQRLHVVNEQSDGYANGDTDGSTVSSDENDDVRPYARETRGSA